MIEAHPGDEPRSRAPEVGDRIKVFYHFSEPDIGTISALFGITAPTSFVVRLDGGRKKVIRFVSKRHVTWDFLTEGFHGHS